MAVGAWVGVDVLVGMGVWVAVTVGVGVGPPGVLVMVGVGDGVPSPQRRSSRATLSVHTVVQSSCKMPPVSPLFGFHDQ